MSRNRYFNLGLIRLFGASALAVGAGALNYYGLDENGNLDGKYLIMDVMVGVDSLILGVQGLRDIFLNRYRQVVDLPTSGLKQIYLDNLSTP